MDSPAQTRAVEPSEKKLGCLAVLGLMFLTIVISVSVTVWILSVYLFPKRFEPVELSAAEQQTLERKLQVFSDPGHAGDASTENSRGAEQGTAGTLQPLPYSEQDANRSLLLSERELNAILAKNTDLADKMAIDLSDDLVSARLRIPMDPDFPFFGGKLLKARAGMQVRFERQRPVMVLKGVSVMGVPIPNAWLGGLKNIDLVSEFGQSKGFWKSFSDGIEHVKVVDGALQIRLKE